MWIFDLYVQVELLWLYALPSFLLSFLLFNLKYGTVRHRARR